LQLNCADPRVALQQFAAISAISSTKCQDACASTVRRMQPQNLTNFNLGILRLVQLGVGRGQRTFGAREVQSRRTGLACAYCLSMECAALERHWVMGP
jgi:hypothetical protein